MFLNFYFPDGTDVKTLRKSLNKLFSSLGEEFGTDYHKVRSRGERKNPYAGATSKALLALANGDLVVLEPVVLKNLIELACQMPALQLGGREMEIIEAARAALHDS